MVRRFFRDSAIYAVPAAVSTGTSFVTFPLYAHRFEPRAYGILDLLSFTSTLVVLTVALEIYQGVGRYVTGEKDFDVVRAYASTALWWTVACYLLFGAFVLLFARPICSVILGSSAPVSLLRIALGWTSVQGVVTLLQAQLRWQLRPKAFAAVSGVNAAATASSGLAFVFAAHLGVAGVLWGQLVGSGAALLLVAVLLRKTIQLSFDRTRWRRMVRFSAPLVISNAGVFLNLYADRFVIQHLRSLGDVGRYGVANRVAMLTMLLLVGFQGAAVPLFLSRRDDPSTPAAIARIFRLFTALALAMALGLSILAPPLLRVLAAAPYQSAAEVVPFLVVSTLFANMYMFAPGLVIAERTRAMARLTIVAGVCNLLLALALVPPLGIIGAGLATAVTSFGWFAALMRASQRCYRVPHRFSQLVRAAAVAAGLIGVSFASLHQTRAEMLDLGPLALRLVLVSVGVAVCGTMCLGVDELGGLIRRARSVRGLKTRALPSRSA
jgi:O-antigen/teichoic acid export membrane protein